MTYQTTTEAIQWQPNDDPEKVPNPVFWWMTGREVSKCIENCMLPQKKSAISTIIETHGTRKIYNDYWIRMMCWSPWQQIWGLHRATFVIFLFALW